LVINEKGGEAYIVLNHMGTSSINKTMSQNKGYGIQEFEIIIEIKRIGKFKLKIDSCEKSDYKWG
jgi:hypothetical protein